MQLSHKINDLLTSASHRQSTIDGSVLITHLDHTRLKLDDTFSNVIEFCKPASGVASVCVYPQYIQTIKKQYPALTICTVVNFPNGDASLATITGDITQAIQNGAQEIDLVLPFTDYLSSSRSDALQVVYKVREHCGADVILKVILETEEFTRAQSIYEASLDCLNCGANFIKTSTGTRPIGATPEAAAAILLAIHDSGLPAGLKVSGGIQNLKQCADYINIAQELFGEAWLSPSVFRVGSSRLLNCLKNDRL